MPQSIDYGTDNLMLFTRFRLRSGQQSTLADSAIHVTVGFIGSDADVELMLLKTLDFMCPTRPAKTIHFYTYNNSWSLDVECEYNWKMAVTNNNVNDLHEMYDCHEFDELLEELNTQNIPEEERPVFYCFALGNIIERRNI